MIRFVLILALSLALPLGAETRVPQNQAEISLSFAPLVRDASPAVVNIFANRVVQQRESPFRGNPMFEEMFREFATPRPQIENSLGSGVILSPDGIVVSNYHVVGMATEIRVVLKDRREFAARVLLGDEASDLAILKIEAPEPLPHLPLRDSDDVEVGELALAIGNPFGVGQTVSSGIISGLARSGIATGNARGYFIQTDAPINPGNSGGALIDIQGRLIGINTSILTRSGGSNGIGFAIPANLVAQFVVQARQGNDMFQRPWAGLHGQMVDAALAEALGLRAPRGVAISAIHPLSPFLEAGVAPGDIILEVDGQPVNAPAEMLFRMSVRSLGERIGLRYWRAGDEREASAVLIAPPDAPPADPRRIEEGPLTGLEVSNVNPAVQVLLRLATDTEGVVVTAVPRSLRGIGLTPGDILLGINGRNVTSTADVVSAAREATRWWRFDGLRSGKRFTNRFRI